MENSETSNFDSFEKHEMPKNYMALNIIMLILGLCPALYCLNFITALVGLIFSSQVKKKYEAGDYAGAISSSKTAKILGFVSLGLFIIIIIMIVIALASGEFMQEFEKAMEEYERNR